jgi:ABC-type sugar transport system, permease component
MKAEMLERRYNKIKKRLLGNRQKSGILFLLFVYTMLISLGFVYLYPILHMMVTSIKSLPDLMDASVNWIPTSLSLGNFKEAFEVLNFNKAIWDTILIAVLPAIGQTICAALTGYAFARYNFPLKKLMLALVLVTFVLPPYVLMVSKYTMFSDYKLLGKLWVLLLPATTGQGINSAIFVLIFLQFFKQTPLSLDEAARVDGAGEARIFFGIALPLAMPAVVVSFLFSLVWYWNETYFTTLFVVNASSGTSNALATLLIELARFETSYKGYLQSVSGTWGVVHSNVSVANEAVKMAATLVTITPLLIVYGVMQRQFVQSIDRTGITGE